MNNTSKIIVMYVAIELVVLTMMVLGAWIYAEPIVVPVGTAILFMNCMLIWAFVRDQDRVIAALDSQCENQRLNVAGLMQAGLQLCQRIEEAEARMRQAQGFMEIYQQRAEEAEDEMGTLVDTNRQLEDRVLELEFKHDAELAHGIEQACIVQEAQIRELQDECDELHQLLQEVGCRSGKAV